MTLTDEEKAKRTEGRAEYQRAIEYLENDLPVYEIEPVCTIASSLVAGKLSESKASGILGYVNAIRVAAGLPKLKEVIQHIMSHSIKQHY